MPKVSQDGPWFYGLEGHGRSLANGFGTTPVPLRRLPAQECLPGALNIDALVKNLILTPFLGPPLCPGEGRLLRGFLLSVDQLANRIEQCLGIS